MNIKNLNKKAQGLPLNTIVIAILVIIVLLVIIVFFTSRVGETGNQLDKNSIAQCSPNNPAIATLYPDKSNNDFAKDKSSDDNYKKVPAISNCWVTK